MSLRSVLLILVIALARHQSSAAIRFQIETSEPLNYDVRLTIDMDAKRFTAEEFILIAVNWDTTIIGINSYALDVNWFESVRLISEDGGQELIPSSVKEDSEGNIYYLTFDGPLYANTRHTLHIKDIRGEFGAGLIEDIDPESSVYLLTTGFNNTNLRAVFPCYDQPSYRSTYKFTIYHPPGYKLVTNSDEVTTDGPIEDSNNFMRNIFEIRKPFPTVSIGFMLTTIDVSKSLDNRIRVYHPDPESREILRDNFHSLLLAVEKELQLPMEVPKIDIVFAHSLSSITRSKWGMIAVNPDLVPIVNNIQMAAVQLKVIQKEIAMAVYSQFFGQLVTHQWWDEDEWVIMGMARYLSGVSKHLPFDAGDEFVVDVVQTVIRKFDFHHGILGRNVFYKHDINKPAMLMKDLRGGSVMRTLASLLGKDQFHRAAIGFLKNNLYSSVFATDFGQHLDHYKPFVELPGVTQLSNLTYNYGNNGPYKNSFRLYKEENQLKISPIFSLVASPIDYMTPSIELGNAKKWYVGEALIFKDFEHSWIVIDPHQYSLLRVDYGDHYWPIFAQELQNNHTTMFYRRQLIADSANEVHDNYLHMKHYLNLIEYLPKETDPLVWKATRISYETVAMVMRGYEGNMTVFNNYFIGLVDGIYKANRIGSDSGNFEITREVAKIACSSGHALCIQDAIDYSKDALANDEYMVGSSDFQEFIYCTLAQVESTKNLMRRHVLRLWAKDRRVNAPSRAAIKGMACTSDANIIQGFLEFSISNNLNQELDIILTPEERSFFLYAFLHGSHDAVRATLRFILLNYDAISEGMSEWMEDVFEHVCLYIRSKEQLQIFQDLLKIHKRRMPEATYTSIYKEASEGAYYQNMGYYRQLSFDEWAAERGSGLMVKASSGILLVLVTVVIRMFLI